MGALQTKYVHGVGTGETLGHSVAATNRYYHSDRIVSITSITDSNSNPAQSYVYKDFGNFTQSTSLQDPFTFTGSEWDSDIGLYFDGRRYYDRDMARFVTKQNGIGENPYSYVENNPVNDVSEAKSACPVLASAHATPSIVARGGGSGAIFACNRGRAFRPTSGWVFKFDISHFEFQLGVTQAVGRITDVGLAGLSGLKGQVYNAVCLPPGQTDPFLGLFQFFLYTTVRGLKIPRLFLNECRARI